MTHKLAAKYTVAKNTFAGRLADNERGASALEYVGMIIVAAMIVGGIMAVIDQETIKGVVEENYNKIIGTE